MEGQMVDVVQREDIRSLMGVRGGPCISIYMPSFRAGTETLQNPIRFKNQLKEAEAALSSLDLRSAEARQLLGPLEDLVDNYQFWQHQSGGLALFRSPDLYRYFRVPHEFDELAVVTGRFHLKPLLRLFSWDSRFYILCLSTNAVRLLEATRYAADELELPAGVPASLAEAVGTGAEPQLQVRSMGQGPGGGQTGVFYGQDAGNAHKERLAQYFRKIDRGLRSALQEDRAPMVLAGVDYLLPIYRSVSSYPNLAAEQITGNVEDWRPEQLQQRAAEAVAPVFAQAEQAAVAAYHQRSQEGKALHDVAQVVPAAHHGRVDTLFVGVGVQRWGRYLPETGRVELHDAAAPGGEDLLDLAAADTILNSGTVFALDPARVPDGPEVAAILRY